MKLPLDASIPDEKLTQYLLVPQIRGDKSAYLALAGYTPVTASVLLRDLRDQLARYEASPLEATVYGQLYEIRGTLLGPNGRKLHVRTIWITENLSRQTRFITLIPDNPRALP